METPASGCRCGTSDPEEIARIARCHRDARNHLRWAGQLMEEAQALADRVLKPRTTNTSPPKEACHREDIGT